MMNNAGKWRAVSRYIIWYLAGILAAIALTPVSFVLVGVHLWPYYIALPGISFVLFYAGLTPEYVMGATMIYWVIYVGGLAAFFLGLATALPPIRHLRPLRPPMIGLSLGFIGAMGIFYTVAASI